MALPWHEAALHSFLLSLPALFSIINPLGGALIFAQVTASRSHADRAWLARRIGLYAALVMLVSLWTGAAVLSFFGVSLAALRIAGGLVVAASAWNLLAAPETREATKTAEADPARAKASGEVSGGLDEIAFFPLTLPFTTGPGTISVAIALGANRPKGDHAAHLGSLLGDTVAALVITAAIVIAYASADWVVERLGHARVRVLGRLAAFLLLCVGIQITVTGVTDVLLSIQPGHAR
ncbi:MAG: MarC family protein [Methylobacterium frigidaeris]